MAIWNFWKQEKINVVRIGCLDGTSLETAIRIRAIDPNIDSEELIKDKKLKPFKTDKDISVYIVTNLRTISFIIKAGYTWDGATIPRFFWSIVGGKENPSFLTASMIHDYMLEHKEELGFKTSDSPRLTSLIFREILKEDKTGDMKSNVMAGAVHGFQYFICSKEWR